LIVFSEYYGQLVHQEIKKMKYIVKVLR